MKWILFTVTFLLMAALPADSLHADEAEFHARFEQSRTTPGLDRAFESQGRVHWLAGAHLEWATETPFRHVYRLYSDRIIEIHDDGEREEIHAEDAPWVVSLNELMMALVGGDREALEKRFEIEWLEENETARFRLIPRDDALAEQIEAMEVTQKTWPERILIREADGGELDIRLSDHEGEAPAQP